MAAQSLPEIDSKEAAESRDSQRVIFTFDRESYEALKRMTEEAGFKSMAETVREALRITRALQDQAASGFKEVILRNPNTNRERTLVIPLLDRLAHRSAEVVVYK